MHAIHSADTSAEERVSGMISEIFRDKIIDKGVYAAVEGRQAEGDEVEGIDVALPLGFDQEIMHYEQKVARSEADEVHGQHGDDKSDSPPPFLLRVLIHGRRTECFDHEHIGRRSKEGREQKDSNGQGEEVIEHVPHQYFLRQHIITGGDVQGRNVDGLFHDIQRDGDQKNQKPDCQGDANSNVCLLPGVSHGVYDHPVPLHAEAGHEKDGAIHVAIEKANEHFAQDLAIGPVVAM